MMQPNYRVPGGARRSRLTGGMRAGVLIALGAALNACDGRQPTGLDRVAPERPSLALNPACAGTGGVTHTDSILVNTTWTPGGNPHRVDHLIHIEGAVRLRLDPGTLVCFGSGGGLRADNGGRVQVLGSAVAPVVLTATDPAGGWLGVRLAGTPSAASGVKNLRLEHTRTEYALSTHGNHKANIDSALFRQNELGLYLWGHQTSLRRSHVDTVTSAAAPAVTLGRTTTFQQTIVRGAAGVGLAVLGTDSISLLGGRVEGSGGVGLQVTTPGTGFLTPQPVRVTGGASYPAEMNVSAAGRLYSQSQDSLLGNARDTLVVTGGTLRGVANAGPALPWRVTAGIDVKGQGSLLSAAPGATLRFDPSTGIVADSGAQVSFRGAQAAPVLFTGSAWLGIQLVGTPWKSFQGPLRGISYVTNVRIEGADGVAVMALHPHPVVIDSTVFRQNGAAAWLMSTRSRISRSRVDTTTRVDIAAVLLQDSATLESTIIRGSAERGLVVASSTATVQGCEIRDSAADAIELWADGIQVHDCNLVNNGGAGISALSTFIADGENNWWGDAAGPTGPGGDGVSGAVDYTPWRTTPYVLPYIP